MSSMSWVRSLRFSEIPAESQSAAALSEFFH